jgi:hypothetical protein
LETHPEAELFPLMSESELTELAADIRANGLRQPIVLKDGKVLDGRNRYRACELADVEPRFEEADGVDPLTFVISLNRHRRQLTASQAAMAAARAWRQAEAEGRVQSGAGRPGNSTGSGELIRDPRNHFAKLLGAGRDLTQNAKALLDEAPDLAAEIDGGETVATQYAALQQRRKEATAEAQAVARRNQIRTKHADLWERVEKGELDPSEAYVEVQQREAEEERELEDEAQSRRILTKNIVSAVELLQMRTDDDSVRSDIERLDPEWLTDRFTAETIRRAADYLDNFHQLRHAHGQ